jgi:hypothetical protein
MAPPTMGSVRMRRTMVVSNDRFGKVSFSFITVEDVTATATAFSTKETSEFSAPRTVSSS